MCVGVAIWWGACGVQESSLVELVDEQTNFSPSLAVVCFRYAVHRAKLALALGDRVTFGANVDRVSEATRSTVCVCVRVLECLSVRVVSECQRSVRESECLISPSVLSVSFFSGLCLFLLIALRR